MTQPSTAMQNLDRLIGTWELSDGLTGQVRWEWMAGGFFLMQHVDMVHDGHHIKGLEIIGHEHPFGGEPSEDIKSRFYDAEGNTLDYVYELEGDTLIIWGGQKGSPAYFKGSFNHEGTVLSGGWVYPGGGGYSSTMTKVK